MFKKFLVIMALVLTFGAGIHPVNAAPIGEVYVDTAYTGSEDGTKEHPYNKIDEGKALAQNMPGGAWIYLKQPDGSWLKYQYIPPVKPGATGIPLTATFVYVLLAALALILLFVGWQFQRRARQMTG